MGGERGRRRRLERIDASSEPRPVRAPFWARWVLSLPPKFGRSVEDVLTEREIQHLRDRALDHQHSRLNFITLAFLPYLTYYAFWLERGNTPYLILDIGIPALSLAFIGWMWRRYQDKRIEFYITVRIINLIWMLDRNGADWLGRPAFARLMNPVLAGIARRMMRMPLGLKSTHPGVVQSVERKAAAFDDLQQWVSTPIDTTYNDLLSRLKNSIALVIRGRWFDLPESDSAYVRVMTKIERWTWGVTGFVVIAAGIAAGVFDDSVPSFIKFVTPIAIAGGVLCLGRAGLVPGTLQQALDTSSSLRASANESED